MNTTDTSVTGSYMPPPPTPGQPPKPRRRHPVLFALSMISAIGVAGIVGIAAVAAGSHPAVHRDTLPGSGTVTFTPEAVQPVNPITAAPVVPQYSIPQQQAIAAARSYLETEPGFSKAGLISQLHSKYGNGFSEKLAVFAVTHVKVNWFQQAVYSAKSYMQTEPGWSYSGLVDQLHSPYGAQFTLRQAEYGAHKVGL